MLLTVHAAYHFTAALTAVPWLLVALVALVPLMVLVLLVSAAAVLAVSLRGRGSQTRSPVV
jgi:hypothetical protein